MPKLICFLAFLIPASIANAELQVHGLFSDHAVLQRDQPIPVWGTANPGESVRVTLAEDSQTTLAQSDGTWRVWLPERSAETGLTLVVQSADQEHTVADVSVGEVWLCSGQSNMNMWVQSARDFKQEQAASDHPQIRSFRVNNGTSEQPRSDVSGRWQVSAPDTVGRFSATAYFFARKIRKELDVPIGVVVAAVGGTPIESWTREAAQRSVPELQPLIANLEQKQRDIGGLYNGNIAPVVPYAIRGVLWYQGEKNTFPDAAPYYQYQLPLLVNDWRKQWKRDQMPFAWAQLPNFKASGRDWATVRQGMLDTLSLPHTGMAITIDLGETDDIHPKNKQDVGARLARWALATVYGQSLTPMGAVPSSANLADAGVEVTFQYAGEGLRWNQEDVRTGFELRAESGEWYAADAEIIDRQTVRIRCQENDQPDAVRYLWSNDPAPTLFNSDAIPASPFQRAW